MVELLYSAQKPELPNIYFKLIWVWIALSSITLIEPSPYDLLFLVCLALALVLSYMSFSNDVILPLLILSLFINANLISLFMVSGDLFKATIFLLITMYLACSWIFFVGILQRYRQEVVEIIFSAYTVSALIAVTVGALAYLGLIPRAELFLLWGRVAGTFKDPNVYGPFLIPAVLYSVFKFESSTGKAQLRWFFIIIVISIGVLLSFSRAAWGNYFISLFFYLLLPPRFSFKDRLIKVGVIVILLCPVIFFILNLSQVSELLSQRLGLIHNYDYNRFGTQLASLKLAMANPLGIGPRQTESEFAYSTHSLYVRVLTEYGLGGITSFSYFILLTLFRSFKHNFSKDPLPYSAVVTASLVGILFNSFFIDTLHWRHLWLLLALPWIPFRSGD